MSHLTPAERQEIIRACKQRIEHAKHRKKVALSQPRPTHWNLVIKRCESAIDKLR